MCTLTLLSLLLRLLLSLLGLRRWLLLQPHTVSNPIILSSVWNPLKVAHSRDLIIVSKQLYLARPNTLNLVVVPLHHQSLNQSQTTVASLLAKTEIVVSIDEDDGDLGFTAQYQLIVMPVYGQRVHVVETAYFYGGVVVVQDKVLALLSPLSLEWLGRLGVWRGHGWLTRLVGCCWLVWLGMLLVGWVPVLSTASLLVHLLLWLLKRRRQKWISVNKNMKVKSLIQKSCEWRKLPTPDLEYYLAS